MVKMQMRQDHHIDVHLCYAQLFQIFEEKMPSWRLNAVAFGQLGRKTGTDTGFTEDLVVVRFDQHRATGQLDTIVAIRQEPALPKRFGGIAKHSPPIESLTIPLYCSHRNSHTHLNWNTAGFLLL